MIKNDKGGIGNVRFLSKEDMQKIHEQALRVLDDTGIGVESDAALQMLGDAGAVIDAETQTAKIPPDLVEQALETLPRRITLAGRNPERDLVLEPGGKMRSRNAGGLTQIQELETGEIRDALLADVADFARLMDGLDDIDFVAPLYPSDVPPEILELQVLETMFSNTDKHINIRALTRRTFPYLIQMGEIVAGGKENLKERPVISILEAPIAPLRFPDVFIDALFLGGEYGIPIEVCSMPSVGATGPMTLAGSLLLATAEHLATFVISQLAHPGAPVIWASRFTTMDMSTGVTGMHPEAALVNAAGAQMATDHYNMICDVHGPATNAIVPDGQSVLEECVGAFITGFAGRPTVLAGAGSMEIGLIASFEEMVISNEIHSMIRRAIEGFEVSDETLGADAIARVGIGGNFLQDEHTFKYLRGGRLDSLFIKPKNKVSWIESGSKGMVDIAREKARTILKEHQTTPLDEGVKNRLQELIKDAQSAFNA